jgi:hypothetical protein
MNISSGQSRFAIFAALFMADSVAPTPLNLLPYIST